MLSTSKERTVSPFGCAPIVEFAYDVPADGF